MSQNNFCGNQHYTTNVTQNTALIIKNDVSANSLWAYFALLRYGRPESRLKDLSRSCPPLFPTSLLGSSTLAWIINKSLKKKMIQDDLNLVAILSRAFHINSLFAPLPDAFHL